MPIMAIDDAEDPQKGEFFPELLPILPLKNTVMFPGVVLPITIGREKAIRAVQRAYETHKYIAVLSQRDADSDNISTENLYQVGTIARILRLLKMPDGSTTAIFQGRKRMELVEMISDEPFLQGDTRTIDYIEPRDEREFEALIDTIRDKSSHIIDLSPNIPNEAQVMLKNITNNVFLLNFIASNMGLKPAIKQSILEINSLSLKAETILLHMDSELQLLELKGEIETKVRVELDKQQRDYFLSQHSKPFKTNSVAIHKKKT